MASYADTYEPIIEAALNGNEEGHTMLAAVAEGLTEQDPERFPSIETATEFVHRNFSDYADTRTRAEAAKVKEFYGLEPQPPVASPSF